MKEDRKREEMHGNSAIPTLPRNLKKGVRANVDENGKAD